MENVYISQRQLNNAKMYSNRWDWLKTLPAGLNIMEVGVAAGDYSNRILERNPNKLVLVDLFNNGDITIDHANNPRFSKGDGLNFVTNRLNSDSVVVLQGDSHNLLPQMKQDYAKSFDMIYIDADHSYDSVVDDINNSLPLLKDSGILALNDYLIADTFGNEYGVVFAANHFLYENPEWEVIGFALDRQMFCDIHLRKVFN